MRLLCVADVHVGNFARFGGAVENGLNARCRLTLATLQKAVDLAREREALPVVAGDLFHVKRPEPSVIAGVQRALAPVDQPVVMLGNHDAIGPGDHALAPLAPVARVVSRAEGCLGDVLFVPWSPEPALARLDAALAKAPAITTVVMHCGIYDSTFPEFLRGDGALEVHELRERMAAHGVRLALAGDYHRHKAWHFDGQRVSIAQVGALNPTGFSDEGLEGYGSALLVDTQAGTFERIEIPGPRFVAADSPGDLVRAKKAGEAGNTVFLRLRCAPGGEQQAELVAAEMAREPWCGGVEVEPAGESAPQADAQAQPAPLGFPEALAEYVGKMDLPEGVERPAVMETARRYL